MLRKLHMIKRNKLWWQSTISLRLKMLYYVSILGAYSRQLLKGEKVVHYLGTPFHYDNTAVPLTMMIYPNEISQKIIANTDSKNNIKNILDIGGNIGQFSTTIQHILSANNPRVDVFEPNPNAYKLLQLNTNNIPGITAFNFGVGSKKVSKMYYGDNQTATGSIYEKSVVSKGAVTATDVTLTESIHKHTKRKNYDLIKIDVEGYELEVIKHLKGLRTKYLFLEVQGVARHKPFEHSELFQPIKQAFGEFNIVHITELDRPDIAFDMLLEFKNASTKN